jgi:hypothetical protein
MSHGALKSAARVLHHESGLERRDVLEIVGLDASGGCSWVSRPPA